MRYALPFFLVACVLLGASHVAAGQTKYGVTVQTVNQLALAKASTYVWKVMRPAFDKSVDALIVSAVDRQLAARGFKKLLSGPSDVEVTYASLNRTDVDTVKAPESGSGREFAVGTLVVDLSEPKKGQILFRVRIDTPIDLAPATREATINAAVTAMFEKYPSPPKR